MITFKASDKKLEEYIEMGIKFGTAQKGDKFEDYGAFINAVMEDPTIRSSSAVNYDNQEWAWRKFAERYNYDGLKELANEVVKLLGTEDDTFPGLEGLAVYSDNKKLLEISDYAQVGDRDQLLVSMFYGGNRMKQWKKYAKPYITPQCFINELMTSVDFDNDVTYDINAEKVDNTTVKVYFDTDDDNNDTKKRFYQMLENGDELFDFHIQEEYVSNIWTITVQ
jgi:hypothetical protein